MSALNSSEKLLDDLGGHKRVAARLGVKANLVWNWRKRGIAGKYRAAIAQLATERDIQLPDDFLPQLRPVVSEAAE